MRGFVLKSIEWPESMCSMEEERQTSDETSISSQHVTLCLGGTSRKIEQPNLKQRCAQLCQLLRSEKATFSIKNIQKKYPF